ncbi:hypothetical protein [Psychrobacter pygoscelis]|uniref:hypothetical protein n=1 Tax=Psychrobacter pygoscelis TaxID=2488563 RepID=UPI0010393ED3|nr:hypothetical protein [Psychrobacter pygoscelis]
MRNSTIITILSLGLFACSSNDTPSSSGPTIDHSTEVEAEAEENHSNEPANLESAITAFKPSQMDYYNEFPAVLGPFINWNEKVGASWEELNAIEETTYGKVMKDPIAEYGKRLCVNGNIVEIDTDRSMSQPLYNGGLADYDMNFYRFTAFGSTGDLVANSNAIFCGIVVGRLSFDNSIGGTTNAPYLFGMFDLPANK